MQCQRCNTQNIKEAIRCSNCGVKLKIQPTLSSHKVESNQSIFVVWFKEFIKHIVRPRGIKLWIIIVCSVLFVLPAFVSTLVIFVVKPYLIERQKENISKEYDGSQHDTQRLEIDLNAIQKNQTKANDVKKAIQTFYSQNKHYPAKLIDLKGFDLESYDNFSMNHLGYLIVKIEASTPIKMIIVPFLNSDKNLTWDCYITGFDSALAETRCIEISSIDEIPENPQPLLK